MFGNVISGWYRGCIDLEDPQYHSPAWGKNPQGIGYPDLVLDVLDQQ